MSVITLKNRVTTHSDSDVAFASCTALPIHQTTLNVDEMAGIDGLWDWGEFNSQVIKSGVTTGASGAIIGGITGGITAAVATSPTGPGVFAGIAAGTWGGAKTGFAFGYAAGVVGAAIVYTYDEITSD